MEVDTKYYQWQPVRRWPSVRGDAAAEKNNRYLYKRRGGLTATVSNFRWPRDRNQSVYPASANATNVPPPCEVS